MAIFNNDNKQFEFFIADVKKIYENLESNAKKEDIDEIEKFIHNFKLKTDDFYRNDRRLNIGVVGQVKAGKSSFLNTLLFDGKEILPKASTPKTATLTKMEYSENNIIEIEYYSVDDWEIIEDNASIDLEDEIYTSARELVGMVRRNGIEPQEYLEKGTEQIKFDTYENLVKNLNNYVGEDGKFTPIIKSVTLYVNKEEFKGLSIVDTPGLNDPIASRTLRTKEFMELCDVVFFLSQTGSFLDKSDWELLSSQLPQKGVKKLVLIGSKYDSGIRDILRVKDELDDIFGEDDNKSDNISGACKIINKKLKKRAKSKVLEFIEDLKARGSSSELMEVIKQCSEPILISAISHNMSNKNIDDYSAEEKNIYSGLKPFSKDMVSDLKLLGNFDKVNEIFKEVIGEKEAILEKKAKSFIPTATLELKSILERHKEKANTRLITLENNDKGQLEEQRKYIESQIGNIRADITTLFGELNTKLEEEKATGIRELREASKDYLEIKERTGTITKHSSYTTGHFFWKKTHHYTYDEHYSYCSASDAVENIRKFSIDAVNQVEEVFTEALQLKEIKRKLLNVVVNNFDMGSEKYDSALFRIMIEETVSNIEFPVFNIDISQEMGAITSKFSGEITSSREKTELSTALSTAISKIYDGLCDKLVDSVKNFKSEMNITSQKVQNALLEKINSEFNELLKQCEHKDKEIAEYKSYITAIEQELVKL